MAAKEEEHVTLFSQFFQGIREWWAGLFLPKTEWVKAGRPSSYTRLYVGNLNYSAREEDVKRLFEQCGSVVEVNLVRDKRTKKPKGFAFIEMADQAGLEKALALGGKDFMGRNLTVSVAKSQKNGGGRFKGRFRSRRNDSRYRGNQR